LDAASQNGRLFCVIRVARLPITPGIIGLNAANTAY
jgi:hypothetical protein